MPDLLIPEGEELEFHAEMLENKASVDGIRLIPGQDPAEWREYWEKPDDKDHFYRLVYCDGCGYSVGDVAYRRTTEHEADLWLMILGDMRNDGYGSAVLKQIALEAKQNGIETLRIVIPNDHPNIRFFKNRYFIETEPGETETVLCAATDDLLRCHCSENVCSLADHKRSEAE